MSESNTLIHYTVSGNYKGNYYPKGPGTNYYNNVYIFTNQNNAEIAAELCTIAYYKGYQAAKTEIKNALEIGE